MRLNIKSAEDKFHTLIEASENKFSTWSEKIEAENHPNLFCESRYLFSFGLLTITSRIVSLKNVVICYIKKCYIKCIS